MRADKWIERIWGACLALLMAGLIAEIVVVMIDLGK